MNLPVNKSMEVNISTEQASDENTATEDNIVEEESSTIQQFDSPAASIRLDDSVVNKTLLVETDEEEDEEEEPKLKYNKLNGTLSEIFVKDAISTVCVSDRFLVNFNI